MGNQDVRALRIATAVALTTALVGALGGATGVAVADDGAVPSRQDVHEARVAVREKADDVASVRAQLVVANQRLQSSAIAAARAAEAFNGARWRVHEAQLAARAAERRSEIAQGDVDRQRDIYSDALVTSYQLAPGLTALSAITRADGIEMVIDRATTMHNAEDALDGQYDAFRASATLADVATQQAEAARATAREAQEQARVARDAARAAASSAAADARSIAAQKSDLIEQLASLEHISVNLAERRQSALEAQAAVEREPFDGPLILDVEPQVHLQPFVEGHRFRVLDDLRRSRVQERVSDEARPEAMLRTAGVIPGVMPRFLGREAPLEGVRAGNERHRIGDSANQDQSGSVRRGVFPAWPWAY